MNWKGWIATFVLGAVCVFLVLAISKARGQADPRIWRGMGTTADINNMKQEPPARMVKFESTIWVSCEDLIDRYEKECE